VNREECRGKPTGPIISDNSTWQAQNPVRNFISQSRSFNHSTAKFAIVMSKYQ